MCVEISGASSKAFALSEVGLTWNNARMYEILYLCLYFEIGVNINVLRIVIIVTVYEIYTIVEK